nr:hypothetical protein CFP56_19651 [Quercus suber]
MGSILEPRMKRSCSGSCSLDDAVRPCSTVAEVMFVFYLQPVAVLAFTAFANEGARSSIVKMSLRQTTVRRLDANDLHQKEAPVNLTRLAGMTGMTRMPRMTGMTGMTGMMRIYQGATWTYFHHRAVLRQDGRDHPNGPAIRANTAKIYQVAMVPGRSYSRNLAKYMQPYASNLDTNLRCQTWASSCDTVGLRYIQSPLDLSCSNYDEHNRCQTCTAYCPGSTGSAGTPSHVSSYDPAHNLPLLLNCI